MKPLRIAIQKSGRLKEGSLSLLAECGITIENGRDKLKVSAYNFPLEVLFLRNSDIPQYVLDGVADVAIIGENILVEKGADLDQRLQLGFSRCKVSLAVPKDVSYEGLSFFEGKKVATSYPNTLRSFLTANGVTADIHVISGSVEIAPNIGLADGICDIVSSGNTLFTNGLREVEVLLKSQACLASRRNLDSDKQALLEKLVFRMSSVMASRNNKYVLLNAPNDRIDEIAACLPGIKSPTIIPLLEEGWSSVHSVINENDFWEVIDELKNLGAEGILIVPIQKMIQ